jgi:integrase
MKPLTASKVASLKPRPERYQEFDGICPGLSIRVFPSGGKSWVWQYREHVATDSGFEPGKRTRFWTLGKYPAVTLKEARTITDKARSRLKTKGIDPAVGKREARNTESFDALAADYIERHAKPKKKSWKEDQRQLRAEILPAWHNRPVKTITRRDVYALLDPIAHRGAPVSANRVLALLSRIFTYGIDRDWLDQNPAARIDKQPETPRDRILTDKELKGFMTVLHGGNPIALGILRPMIALGLELMLRTGQRAGEVFEMEWADVVKEESGWWWTIPGEKVKNGKTHRVPLTKAALALITKARTAGSGPDGLVFVGPEGGSYRSRAVKVVSTLRTAGAITGDYWRHDVRRTVATGLQALSIPDSTITHVLNQSGGGSPVTRIYARHHFDKEKRVALEAWGRHLDALLTGQPSRVVPFAGKRR